MATQRFWIKLFILHQDTRGSLPSIIMNVKIHLHLSVWFIHIMAEWKNKGAKLMVKIWGYLKLLKMVLKLSLLMVQKVLGMHLRRITDIIYHWQVRRSGIRPDTTIDHCWLCHLSARCGTRLRYRDPNVRATSGRYDDYAGYVRYSVTSDQRRYKWCRGC